jgi:hypothetical protein
VRPANDPHDRRRARIRPGAIVRPLAPHDRIRVLAAAELASASATFRSRETNLRP